MTRITLLVALFVFSLAVFTAFRSSQEGPAENLRDLYAGTPETWPAPHLDEGVPHRELGPLPEVNYPEDNPYTKEAEDLGKMLFFDPRLSVSRQIACASCHDPELGWADGRQFAFGHNRRQGKRNTMSILNTAYFDELFWDGRTASLEEQSLFPLQDHVEMNMDLEVAIARLNSIPEYITLFEEVYQVDSIELEHLQKALATFERGIVSRKSRFDYFVEGDQEALNDQELLGLHLFRTKARCMNCHNGPLFSDNQYHNNGQSMFGRPGEDLGRYLVTEETADVGKFRTPSLRDVTYTGPWLHNGGIFELSEMIDMYERGMPQIIPRKMEGHPLYPQKSPLLKPLNLNSEEKQALLAFLEAISTRPHRIRVPELPQ